ncbi:MAG: ASCH domain-containing protein [Bryobacteraceae bacterium]
MKALSIQQPWAWLIVNGYKDIENRTWDTKHRGEFAVHAGNQFNQDGYDWVRETFPMIEMPKPKDFERGGVVGVASITGTIHESCQTHGDWCGPWFSGPYGFQLRKARPVRFVSWRGQLGFFDVPDEIMEGGE